LPEVERLARQAVSEHSLPSKSSASFVAAPIATTSKSW
jgi:hypothetical protein